MIVKLTHGLTHEFDSRRCRQGTETTFGTVDLLTCVSTRSTRRPDRAAGNT